MDERTVETPEFAKKQAALLGQQAFDSINVPESTETPAWVLKQAAAASNRLIIGGRDSRYAAMPDMTITDPKEKMNLFERGARGIATGFAGMIPASMTMIGGIVDWAGADDAGEAITGAGLSMQEWLDEHVAVENPTFYDHLMGGIGSMASFFIPGIGAATWGGRIAKARGMVEMVKGTEVLTKSGKALQAVFGSSVMSFLEAGVEQAQRQQELMAQGQSPEEALKNSQEVFWYNMPMLLASNAPFFSPVGRAARAAVSTFTEGGQERFQAVVQDVASGRGEWGDFFDPSKYGTETAIGAIIGGGAGAVLPGDASTGDEAVPPPTQDPSQVTPETAAPPPPPVAPETGERPVLSQPEVAEAVVMQGVTQLERGLSEQHKTDIDLKSRLSPAQYAEVATLAGEAQALEVAGEDRQAAWEKADQALNLAEDYLFRGALTKTEQAEADRAAKEAEIFAAREQRKGDYRAEKSVRGLEKAAGAPDLTGFVEPAREAPEPPAPVTKQDYRAQRGVRNLERTAGVPDLGPLVEGEVGTGEAAEVDIQPPAPSKQDQAVEKPATTPVPVAEKPAPVVEAKPKPTLATAPIETIKRKAKKAATTPGKTAMMPIGDVTTEPANLQTRTDVDPKTGYNERRVQAIMDTFDPQRVDPIILWVDPEDGRTKVLNGHHTLEVLKRQGYKDVEVRFYKGTREEAKRASQVWNDQAAQNDNVSRAATAREMRNEATSKTAAEKEIKSRYGNDGATVYALSFLDPKGRVLRDIGSFKTASPEELNNLTKIAKWIGEARRAWPKLTDAHEQEMYDDLRANINKGNRDSSLKFQQFLSKRIDVLDFDPSKPLNLKDAVSRTPAQQTYDAQLAEAKLAKKEADAVLKQKTAAFASMKEPLKTKALKQYEDAATMAAREVNEIEAAGKSVDTKDTGEAALFKLVPAVKSAFNNAVKDDRAAGGITGKVNVVSVESPTERLAAKIGKMFGVDVVLFSAKPGKKTGTAGFYNDSVNTLFINTHREINNPLMPVLMHEVGHRMQRKHPDLWLKVMDIAVVNSSPGKMQFYNSRKEAAGYAEHQLLDEYVADLLGYAATNDSFWTQLKTENPSAFANLVNVIRDILSAIKKAITGHPDYDMSMYVDNFAAIENALARATAEMSRRELASMAEQRQADTTQGTLFKNIPLNTTPEMAAELDKRRAAESGPQQKISSRVSDFLRYVYKKMVDKNTQLYVRTRNALKARGIDISEYDSALRPDLVLQRMAGWSLVANNALKGFGIRGWGEDGKHLSDSFESIVKKYGLAPYIDSHVFGTFMQAARMRSDRELYGDAYFGKPPTEEEADLFEPGEVSQYDKAKAEYARFKKIYDDYLAKYPKWHEAAVALTAFNNAEVQRLYESGALSEAQYNGLTTKRKIYAPLFVIDQEEGTFTGRPGSTAGRVTWEMNQLIPGLVRMDPIDGMIKNLYRIEELAQSNAAKLAATDFIIEHSEDRDLKGYGKQVPNKKGLLNKTVEDLMIAAGMSAKQRKATGIPLTTENEQGETVKTMAKLRVASTYQEDNVMAVMRDGEIEYWEMESDLFDIYAGSNNATMHHLVKFWTAQTNLLRAGAVLTPDFMARNQIRDFAAAGIIARNLVEVKKAGPIPYVNPKDVLLLPARVLEGLSAAIGAARGKPSELWIDFVMSMSGHANLVARDQDGVRKGSEEITRSAGGKKLRLEKFKQNPVKYMLHSHPVTVLQEFSKLTENSTRLAVFKKTRDDLLASGVPRKEALARASIEAREASIDFSRSGEWGMILNRIFPFFNAAVQGNDKMVRAMLKDKGHRQATLARGVMMLTLPTVALWLRNHDEEWYKDQPLWLKNHFWLFSFDGGKTIHKIPKPFEVGLIFSSLPERFLEYAFDQDPEAMKAWGDAFMKNFATIDAGSIGGPITSTVVEIRSNYDAYRDTPIVKGWLEKVVPKEQYTASTSEFAKWVGDTYPGRGLSPLMVDHFIRGSFGGLGRYAADIASNIIMTVEPDRREKKPSSRKIYNTIPDWVPVIKAVTTTTPVKYGRHLDDFYAEYDKAQEAVATLRAYKSGGASKDQFMDLYRRSGVDIAMYESLSRAAEQLGRVSRQIKVTELAPPSALSREDRRKRLDELMVVRNKMIEKYMKKFRSIDRGDLQKKVDASMNRVSRNYDKSSRR